MSNNIDYGLGDIYEARSRITNEDEDEALWYAYENSDFEDYEEFLKYVKRVKEEATIAEAEYYLDL